MVLQTILALGYTLVENSWIVATILTKYFLLGIIIETVWEGRSLSKLEENLLLYRNEFIAAIVILGALKAVTGFTLQPVLETFSQIVAVFYLGYLFWKY